MARRGAGVYSSVTDRTERSEVESEGLGGKFWLMLVGGIFVVCLGGFLLFVFISTAWARWGAIAALIVTMGLILLVAWLIDRRQTRRYEA